MDIQIIRKWRFDQGQDARGYGTAGTQMLITVDGKFHVISTRVAGTVDNWDVETNVFPSDANGENLDYSGILEFNIRGSMADVMEIIRKSEKCPNCGKYTAPGYKGNHMTPDYDWCKYVIVYHQEYIDPDDVHDGDISYQKEYTEIYSCVPDDDSDGETAVTLAAEVMLSREYLTGYSATEFDPRGWYEDADGSRVIGDGHYTGRRDRPSGHLVGFTDREARAVYDLVMSA